VAIAASTRLVDFVHEENRVCAPGALHGQQRPAGLGVFPTPRRALEQAIVRGPGDADLAMSRSEQPRDPAREPGLAGTRRPNEEKRPEARPWHAGAAPEREVVDNVIDRLAQLGELQFERRSQNRGIDVAAFEWQWLLQRR